MALNNNPNPDPSTSLPGSTEDTILAKANKPLQISRYLSEGWRLFISNPGLSVGYTLLIIAVHALLNQIPVLGPLATALLSGPLMGGFYLALRKQLHNHPVQFGDYLAG